LVCEEYLLAGTGGVFDLGFLDIRKELVLDKPKRCFCFELFNKPPQKKSEMQIQKKN